LPVRYSAESDVCDRSTSGLADPEFSPETGVAWWSATASWPAVRAGLRRPRSPLSRTVGPSPIPRLSVRRFCVRHGVTSQRRTAV